MANPRSVRGRTTRRIPDTERAFMLELHERGLSNRRVAEETGYSYTATARIIQEMKAKKSRGELRVEVVPAPTAPQSRQLQQRDELHEVRSLLVAIEDIDGSEARERAVEMLNMQLIDLLQSIMFPNLLVKK